MRKMIWVLWLPLCACGSVEPQSEAPITIDAWYAGRMVTASYRELPSAESATSAEVSILYQADPGLSVGGAFVSVLGATNGVLQPAWREVQVSGNQCASDRVCAVPRQFTSAEELLAAVGLAPHQIHLVATSTHCSVVGVRPISVSSRVPIAPVTTLAPRR
jgi:hypothetical protein